MRAAIRESVQLQEQLAHLRSAAREDFVWSFKGSVPDATVRLQQVAQQLIAVSGGEVRSLSVLPVSQQLGLRKIGVRIDLILPEERLAPWLIAIERAKDPPISYDNLDLQISQSAPAMPGTRVAQRYLSARVDLTSYLRELPR